MVVYKRKGLGVLRWDGSWERSARVL
jgi:hypothetical protein